MSGHRPPPSPLLSTYASWRPPGGSARGLTLLELMVAVAVALTALGMALPSLVAVRTEWQVRRAASYLVTQMMRARSLAARSGAAVGLRFQPDGRRHSYALFLDGDGDGIRTTDIEDGTDPPLSSPVTLEDHFPEASFGLADAVPLVGEPLGADGEDPVRFGSGDVLTFTPTGTATSGTLYVTGRRGHQYAVRVLGSTGRVRVLRYDPSSRRWSDR